MLTKEEIELIEGWLVDTTPGTYHDPPLFLHYQSGEYAISCAPTMGEWDVYKNGNTIPGLGQLTGGFYAVSEYNNLVLKARLGIQGERPKPEQQRFTLEPLCPDCKDTRQYVGLLITEPCRSCC